jgi:hypothetical protein
LKINSKNNNNIFNICTLFSKIKNNDIENSKYSNFFFDRKYPKFLHPIRFLYEEFNEHDKLKFEDNLIYFLS